MCCCVYSGNCFVRYYEDYEIDEVKGLSNLTQMYIEVFATAVLQNLFM